MLITILAWLYITLICWIYGYKILQLLGYSTQSFQNLHFSIICLTGLAFLTVINSFLSLITGLDNIYIHSALLLSSVALSATIPLKSFRNAKDYLTKLSLSTSILLITGCVLVVTMSVWHIKHPDTIDYHSIIIESIKDNKVEKGIALQNLRYGLQSNWFVSCALFSFNFIGFHGLTFINSTFLAWLLCFAAFKIQQSSFSESGKNNHYYSLLWILFLILAFWDYTQIRLTATSASPDFPTTIYILLVSHYFIVYQLNKQQILLLMFLIAATFGLKLFSFPLIVLLFYLGYILLKKYPLLLSTATFILLVTCAPFLLRNYFSSGHLLYPTAFPLIEEPNWHVPLKDLQYLHNYIKAYARSASSEDSLTAHKIANASLSEWLPSWWQLRSNAQKTILLSLPALFILNLVILRKTLLTYTTKQRLLLATALLGGASWFLLAPDPRFGTAYFVLLGYLLLCSADIEYLRRWLNKKGIVFLLSLFSSGLFIYVMYRLIYYFDLINLLIPYSIEQPLK